MTTPPPIPEFPDTDAQRRKLKGAGRASGSGSEDFKSLARFAAISFQLAAEVGAALLIGWLLDHWLGTGRRWTAICGIVGLAIAMVAFVTNAIRMNRKLDRDAAGRRRARSPRHVDDDGGPHGSESPGAGDDGGGGGDGGGGD